MNPILSILFATTAIAAPVSHQVDEHLRLVGSDYGDGNTTATTLDASGNVLTINVQTSTSPGGLFDRDNDGMRDLWEFQYLGSAVGNPAADPDGDGMNNLVEHALATDPQQTSSLPSHAVVANRLQLTFTRRPDAVNLRYDIEALSTSSSQWEVIATGVNSDTWAVTNANFTVNESATASSRLVTASTAIVQPMQYTRLRVKITGPTLYVSSATNDTGIQPRLTAYNINQNTAQTVTRTVTLFHTLATDGAPTPTDY